MTISELTLSFTDHHDTPLYKPPQDCADIPFESTAPVRSHPSYRGQRNWPGLWWSATMGTHVGYESWLKRDHAMLLDFDTRITAFAAQPFWLHYRHGPHVRKHAPTYFVRRQDGTGLVLDCRPHHQHDNHTDNQPNNHDAPGDRAAFDATARACELAGWEYRRRGSIEQPLLGNVAWLAGYRHPRYELPHWTEKLRTTFAVPRALHEGAEATGPPLAVLPVLFHLLWRQQLHTDLATGPLSETSLVHPTARTPATTSPGPTVVSW